MQPLIIESTIDTPAIIFDDEKNIYSIIGKSLPENPAAFYAPAITWFKELAKVVTSGKEIVLDVQYSYFNTASSKLFLSLLDVLEEFQEKEIKVNVNWHYPKGDEDMMEIADSYEELTNIPFVLIEVD